MCLRYITLIENICYISTLNKAASSVHRVTDFPAMTIDAFPEKIPNVEGEQHIFSPGDKSYDEVREQYATKYGQLPRLTPGLIVKARHINDVKAVVQYAYNRTKEDQRLKRPPTAIAIRTGGHQYSGTSSTTRHNIQLDLSTTFKGEEDRKLIREDEKSATIRTSISYTLEEFLEYLSAQGLFVPTGQCKKVALGGHVQTGGYGQLMRSFGLLADHVEELEIVTMAYDDDEKDMIAKVQTIDKSKPDVFFALLGGSPGNFGVLTHVQMKVHKDKAYEGSYGVKIFHAYTPDKSKKLLNILTEIAEESFTRQMPNNYDWCFNFLSPKAKTPVWFPELDPEEFRSQNGESQWDEFFDPQLHELKIPAIVVYAQWVKLKPSDKRDVRWFDRVAEGGIIIGEHKAANMSEIANLWLMNGDREYDLAYVKRTYTTNSVSLSMDRWPEWMTSHFNKLLLVPKREPDVFLVSQIQCSGGALRQKAEEAKKSGTGIMSYSWREDSTLTMTCDAFYKTGYEQAAKDWQRETDTMIGPNGTFAKQDRRLLWGSFGDTDMRNVWRHYYETEKMYNDLRATRKKVDPEGIFTPNDFCVPRD